VIIETAGDLNHSRVLKLMEAQVRGILATVGTPAATGTPTTPETITEART
jgi:hypothetical protein